MLQPELRQHLERLGAEVTPLESGHTVVRLPGGDEHTFHPNGMISRENDQHEDRERTLLNREGLWYQLLPSLSFNEKQIETPSSPNIDLIELGQRLYRVNPPDFRHFIAIKKRGDFHYPLIRLTDVPWLHDREATMKPIHPEVKAMIQSSLEGRAPDDVVVDFIHEHYPELFGEGTNYSRTYSKVIRGV